MRSPARRSERRANRASSARSILSFRVCVAEAESMATALSRSPLYVRGGHLHALEKLFVAHSIHRQEDIYDLSCSMAQRSGGLTGQGCWCRDCLGGKAGWGRAAEGRKGLTGQEWGGEQCCLGDRASREMGRRDSTLGPALSSTR